MALVVDPYTASPGGVIAAAEINARIAAILTQVNGNLDAANLKDAGVTKIKLAADALQAFLQLGVAATRKIRFGNVAPGTWGGLNSIDVTVPHGLGVTPVFAIGIFNSIATFTSGGLEVPVVVSVFGLDATNVTFRCRTSDGGQTNNAKPLYWVAIG